MRHGLARSLLLVMTVTAAGSVLLAGCAPATPPVIRDELARASHGSVTLVVFTDFQCPFCRRTHDALAPIRATQGDRLRVILRHVPLHMHPDARTAARAAVCGESLPAYEGLVDALYASHDLSESACEELAVARGAERESFRRCVAEPATDARIDHDTAMLDALHGDGVPLLYVGRHRYDGAQTQQSLEEAIAVAVRELP